MALLLSFTNLMSQSGKQDSLSQPLKNWDRKYFETPLEKPFLFYVIHGNFSPGNHISTAKYHTAGVPTGIELMKYGPEKHPEYLNSFSKGFFWKKLVKENSTLSNSITNSRECIVLKGEVADTAELNYFRDVVGVIAYLLDNGGVSVYDPQGFMFFSKSTWKEKISEPDGAMPRNYAMTLCSSENGKMVSYPRYEKIRSPGFGYSQCILLL